MELMLKRAEQGDISAMRTVASDHFHERNGCKKDYRVAFKWYEKARLLGNSRSTYDGGWMLVYGQGVPKNTSKGVLYPGVVTGQGHLDAAFVLGCFFAKGEHGLPVDKAEAQRWFEMSLQHELPARVFPVS